MTLKTDIETAAQMFGDLADAIAARDTQAITDAYNALGVRTKIEPVRVRDVVGWAAPSVRAKLQDHADNPASPLRSICLTALDLFGGALSPTLDTVQYKPMLDALVAGGIATAEERAQLDALATVPDVVNEIDVRRSFWADNGDWLGA